MFVQTISHKERGNKAAQPSISIITLKPNDDSGLSSEGVSTDRCFGPETPRWARPGAQEHDRNDRRT